MRVPFGALTFGIFDVNLVIDGNFDGVTVKALLYRLGFSGTMIKRMKTRENGITVNGEHVTVRYTLRCGDVLFCDDADSFEDENPHITPRELPLDIIYEDAAVIAVNKPAEMPTHPSHGHHDDTLANALAFEYKRRGTPFVFRAVNRLDADTSGVVLLAKSMSAAYALSRSIADGAMTKKYLAILDGEIGSDVGELIRVENRMARTRDSIIKREVTDGTYGDLAVTEYTCLYKGNCVSVVSASPVTGRTHQLRVCFSSLGHPIAGDDFYGGSLSLIPRQALHAYSLTFVTPDKNKEITVTAQIPDDMRAVIRKYAKEVATDEICR